jgi:glyoxylase-like metal-dependent hydrolase (beta-lactamase superfamily II)
MAKERTTKSSGPPRVDIISIGTLSRNRLWGESEAVRTAHATCTLIRVGGKAILVDPGLPAAAMGARLFERTGLRAEKIDTIFLTNFRPSHRAGLAIFVNAKVLIHENEEASARQQIEQLLEGAPSDDLDRAALKAELGVLDQLSPAPDSLAKNVDLFPLFGYTPGTCGLLIALPTTTVMIAGDAVPTQDHFLAGQALPDAKDIAGAHESMKEVFEIADWIVPGHDNLFANPGRAGGEFVELGLKRNTNRTNPHESSRMKRR